MRLSWRDRSKGARGVCWCLYCFVFWYCVHWCVVVACVLVACVGCVYAGVCWWRVLVACKRAHVLEVAGVRWLVLCVCVCVWVRALA